MRPTLIQLPISHFCHKVKWGLDQAGIPFDLADVWFREMADFTDLNPEGTVPVLVVDGARICGSQRIMQWIHAQAPEAGLYPGPDVHAWETWADATIGPLVQRDVYRTLYHHPTWYTRNPAVWVAAAAAHGLVRNILRYYKARRFDGRDDAERASYFARVHAQLGDQPFLFGDAPTAADLSTAALLRPLLAIRKGPIHATPGLAELKPYIDRVVRRPRPVQRKRLGKRRAAFGALPEA